MMINDKMREEFEAWVFEFLNDANMEEIVKARTVQDGQSIYLFEDNDEATMCITSMWLAWQASRAAPAVQGEPVAFCEDAALSIAERTFSTEVDEQLASDIIQYAQRLHSLYTAPQPAPDVKALVEALEQIERWDGFPSTGEVWEDSGEPVSYGAAFGSNGERDFMREVARKTLAAYRKGGEE